MTDLRARVRPVDPTMGAGRQVSEAAPDRDGPIVGAIGAVPTAEAETGRLSIAVAVDGRSLVGFGGVSSEREGGKVTGRPPIRPNGHLSAAP
jgi:hypothetical protein